MTIKIYGRRSSANVQKVHWLCLEAGVNFQSFNVGGVFGGHDTMEFKELNPNSTIPVIDDSGFILYESNAIIKYLSVKFNILNIKEQRLNGLINQWMDWSSLVFGTQCAILSAHKMILPREKRNSAMANAAEMKIDIYLEMLNKQLKNNNFIVNNNFSLADIPLGCWIQRCRILNISFSKFNNLLNWLNKLEKMDSYKKSVINSPLPPN